ncbi:hypothetical protein PIB30_020000 [Stylosanthes scabra]|uniref:Uncharacterized protein n=1 Tax=Stylosanthes scabra TaxID=79078 RepID=A0ABU6Q8G3_9FABA|nr:hypothetical protein [Stylosanthes scabra]
MQVARRSFCSRRATSVASSGRDFCLCFCDVVLLYYFGVAASYCFHCRCESSSCVCLHPSLLVRSSLPVRPSLPLYPSLLLRRVYSSSVKAKFLPYQWSHHSIGSIEETFGHLAPAYYLHGVVDEKTDVFAFGVFFLGLYLNSAA